VCFARYVSCRRTAPAVGSADRNRESMDSPAFSARQEAPGGGISVSRSDPRNIERMIGESRTCAHGYLCIVEEHRRTMFFPSLSRCTIVDRQRNFESSIA